MRQSAKICQLNQESTLLVVLPASHNFAMSSAGILGTIYTGSTIVFAADPSSKTAFTLIEQEKVRVVQLVPPLAQAWLASAPKRQPNLETLELIQYLFNARIHTSTVRCTAFIRQVDCRGATHR